MDTSAAAMIRRFREAKPTSRSQREADKQKGSVKQLWYATNDLAISKFDQDINDIMTEDINQIEQELRQSGPRKSSNGNYHSYDESYRDTYADVAPRETSSRFRFNNNRSYLGDSVDTLGSSGFLTLSNAHLKLDAPTKQPQPVQSAIDPYANIGNLGDVTSNLNELLRSMKLESRDKELPPPQPQPQDTISQITNRLQADMIGFASMFGNKQKEEESVEKEQKKRDEAMKELGRREARASLFSEYGNTPTRDLNNTAVGVRSLAIATEERFRSAEESETYFRPRVHIEDNGNDDRENDLLSSAGVDIIQAAVDSDLVAADSIVHNMMSLKRGLGARLQYLHDLHAQVLDSNQPTGGAKSDRAVEGLESQGYVASRHESDNILCGRPVLMPTRGWLAQWGPNTDAAAGRGRGGRGGLDADNKPVPPNSYDDAYVQSVAQSKIAHKNLLGVAKDIESTLTTAMNTLECRLGPLNPPAGPTVIAVPSGPTATPVVVMTVATGPPQTPEIVPPAANNSTPVVITAQPQSSAVNTSITTNPSVAVSSVASFQDKLASLDRVLGSDTRDLHPNTTQLSKTSFRDEARTSAYIAARQPADGFDGHLSDDFSAAQGTTASAPPQPWSRPVEPLHSREINRVHFNTHVDDRYEDNASAYSQSSQQAYEPQQQPHQYHNQRQHVPTHWRDTAPSYSASSPPPSPLAARNMLHTSSNEGMRMNISIPGFAEDGAAIRHVRHNNIQQKQDKQIFFEQENNENVKMHQPDQQGALRSGVSYGKPTARVPSYVREAPIHDRLSHLQHMQQLRMNMLNAQ